MGKSIRKPNYQVPIREFQVNNHRSIQDMIYNAILFILGRSVWLLILDMLPTIPVDPVISLHIPLA